MTAPFSKLVNQAVDNEIALRELEGRDGNLTAAAYLKACAAVPGTDSKEAEAIERALDGHEGPLLRPTLRRMEKAIADFRRSGPIVKIAAYFDNECDSSLARLGATRQSLFFVAARRMTQRKELFGTLTEPGALDVAVKKSLATRAELFAAIEQGFTAGDILLRENDASFRIAPCIAVASGFSERLVNFLVREYDTAQAA